MLYHLLPYQVVMSLSVFFFVVWQVLTSEPYLSPYLMLLILLDS